MRLYKLCVCVRACGVEHRRAAVLCFNHIVLLCCFAVIHIIYIHSQGHLNMLLPMNQVRLFWISPILTYGSVILTDISELMVHNFFFLNDMQIPR